LFDQASTKQFSIWFSDSSLPCHLMNVDCIFCRIVSGDIAAPVVFEDESSIALLDHRPLFPGHSLLIPKKHFETLADLPSDQVGAFFLNAQLLARAVEQAMEAQGTFVAINNRVSQSVPHLHVHIVPRNRKDGLKGFFWPRNRYQSDEQMLAAQQAIRSAILDLQRE
jgi:histidine triad (HIT) family protein